MRHDLHAACAALLAVLAAAATPAGARAATLDITPPTLIAFGVAPFVNVSGPLQQVDIHYAGSDDLSGLADGIVVAYGPSGRYVLTHLNVAAQGPRASGHAAFDMGPFAEPGDWTVAYVDLIDNAGNDSQWDTQALQAFGNTTFRVRNDSGGDVIPPALVSGVVRTPEVSLSRFLPGTRDVHEPARVDLHVTDTGSRKASGAASARLTLCIVNSYDCLSLDAQPAQRFGLADTTLVVFNAPGDLHAPAGLYTMAELTLFDQAGNETLLHSTVFNGDVDFSTLFDRTTIRVVP